MIAAGLGGRGAQGHRGRSAFYDQQLNAALARLLDLGGAQCRSRNASVNGRRLHFLESGAGQPLVLLHGAGGGAANWYRLIEPLSAKFRVLIPDLPGYGFSDSLEANSPLGHQVARVLAQWLQQIGVAKTDVVGTSFGGLVALRLPDHTDVGKIISVDAVGLHKDVSLLLRLATLPVIARFVTAPTRPGTRAMLRYALTATRLAPEHEDGLVDYLYASAQRGDARMLARAFVQFAGPAGQREVLSIEELKRLASRLLVVWGARDNFLPVRGVAQACALAGCPAPRIIPNAGHSPNWEQPDALLQEIVSFLI